jgi:hypothetical protein
MDAIPKNAIPPEVEGRTLAEDSSYQPYEESLPAGPTVNWQVWLLWVLSTMIGYSLSSGLSVLVGTYAPGGAILGPLVGIAGTALVGLAQWLVLRRYIRGMKWPGWIIATATGQLLGGIVSVITVLGPVVFGVLGELPDVIGVTPTQFLIGFLSGLVLGIVIGFLQWLVLRRYVRNAGTVWWIVGTALAQGVAAGVSAVVHMDFGLGGLVTLFISRLLFSAIVGAISGAVLIIILRAWHKRQSTPYPV